MSFISFHHHYNLSSHPIISAISSSPGWKKLIHLTIVSLSQIPKSIFIYHFRHAILPSGSELAYWKRHSSIISSVLGERFGTGIRDENQVENQSNKHQELNKYKNILNLCWGNSDTKFSVLLKYLNFVNYPDQEIIKHNWNISLISLNDGRLRTVRLRTVRLRTVRLIDWKINRLCRKQSNLTYNRLLYKDRTHLSQTACSDSMSLPVAFAGKEIVPFRHIRHKSGAGFLQSAHLLLGSGEMSPDSSRDRMTFHLIPGIGSQ